MSHNLTKGLLLFLLVSVYFAQTKNVIAVLDKYHVHVVNSVFNKYHVHVVNSLPNNNFPLVIHCKSKDNDLGVHNLYVGNDFNWGFHQNVWETTLFFCHFQWSNKQTSFSVFDHYLADEICHNTFVCYWLVKDDGFYLSNVTNPSPDNLVKWNRWP